MSNRKGGRLGQERDKESMRGSEWENGKEREKENRLSKEELVGSWCNLFMEPWQGKRRLNSKLHGRHHKGNMGTCTEKSQLLRNFQG